MRMYMYTRVCDLMIQLRWFCNLGLIARNGPKCFTHDSWNRCKIIISDTVRASSGSDKDSDEKSDGRWTKSSSLVNGRRCKKGVTTCPVFQRRRYPWDLSSRRKDGVLSLTRYPRCVSYIPHTRPLAWMNTFIKIGPPGLVRTSYTYAGLQSQ